jgi:hypothetical protein
VLACTLRCCFRRCLTPYSGFKIDFATLAHPNFSFGSYKADFPNGFSDNACTGQANFLLWGSLFKTSLLLHSQPAQRYAQPSIPVALTFIPSIFVFREFTPLCIPALMLIGFVVVYTAQATRSRRCRFRLRASRTTGAATRGSRSRRAPTTRSTAQRPRCAENNARAQQRQQDLRESQLNSLSLSLSLCPRA